MVPCYENGKKIVKKKKNKKLENKQTKNVWRYGGHLAVSEKIGSKDRRSSVGMVSKLVSGLAGKPGSSSRFTSFLHLFT